MSALTPGTRVGPYEVVSAIGAGGMGEVYRARDTRLDRTVALKVLSSSTAMDPQLRERFEREARAISSLNHPNICVLYDVGRDRPTGPNTAADQNPVEFLVMEYLEGETLAARLGRAPLSINEALGVAIQIASALDGAHRQGIIHRDLKPGNVMLTKPPTSSPGRPAAHVKLLDFGLARLIQSPSATTDHDDRSDRGMVKLSELTMPTMSSPLTMKGTILGTLQYMSPEQLEGKAVDARADIFAFGALIYEMIAGRRPFEGKSQASLIGAILDHDPPPLTSLQPETSPLLADLVARCLAKDPERRWQSTRDLLRQLEWIAAHADAGSTPALAAERERIGTRPRYVRASAIALCAAAMSGAFVAWALWPRASSPPPVSRFVVELPEAQNFTRAGRRVLALSPDGSRLVYVANQQLYLRNLNELTVAPIPGTGGTDPSEPVFSPDGQWVAFWSNNTIRKIPAGGGAAITLSAADNPTGMSWQGDRIVAGQVNAPGIIEVPAGGGTSIKLVDLGATKEQVQSPQLIAGGRAVLFTLRAPTQGWDDSAIVVQDLESGRRTVLLNGGTDARVLPTGHLIYVREGTLFAIAFDEARLAVNGVAKAVQPGVELGTAGFSGTAQVTLSASGTFAFVPGRLTRQNRLVWVDRQGRVERTSLPDRRYQQDTSQMRLSPDGTRVALTILADAGSGQAGAGQDIWVWEIARNALTRLSFTSQAASPVWTPDSQRVCFNASEEVLCQAADGSGQPQPMFKVNGLVELVQVSPDAKWILMEVHDAKTEDDILIAPLQPGAQIQPLLATVGNQEDATLSPDGRWIAYESNESGTPQIFVRPFPVINRGRWQISTNGGADPTWSRNGKEVFFFDVATAGASRPSAIMSVAVLTGPQFVPAAPTVALKYPAAAAQGFAEGTDGRFLLNFPASSEDEASARPRIVVVQNWIEELKRLVPTR